MKYLTDQSVATKKMPYISPMLVIVDLMLTYSGSDGLAEDLDGVLS